MAKDKDDKRSDLESLLAAAGVDVEAAKADLGKIGSAFAVGVDKTVPEGALRTWADTYFHSVPGFWIAVGRMWLGG